jgi:ferredoxin--NADP+ reductase
VELIERIDFTPDLCLMRFKTEAPLTYRPGQYATLAMEDGEKLIQRPYSIVSSPHEPFLEFYIELVPNGELTPHIWELKVGDKAWVRNKIVGAFTLDEKSGLTRHLMAATVTGVAPYISMLRAHRKDAFSGKTPPHQYVVILGGSRSWEWGVYHDELSNFERDGWLQYIPTVSRPWEDTQWKGETGRVEDVIRKYSDQLEFNHTNAVAYACGHPQMIENVRAILERARFPKEHIRDEKFFTIK